MSDTQTTIDRLLGWHQSQGDQAPPREDLEILARLRVTDVKVAEQLLLTDASRVVSQWHQIGPLLLGESSAGSPAADVGEPPTSAVSAPAPQSSAVGALAPAAARRFRRLTEWVADALASGRVVDPVTDEQLVKLAETRAPKRELKLMPQLRTFSDELERLLGESSLDAPETTPAEVSEPVPTPQPDPVAEEPTPAPNSTPDPTPDGPAPPVVTTAPAGRTQTSRRTGAADRDDFAPYDWSLATDEEPVVPKVQVTATGSESLRLTWSRPADDGMVRIYRVVTNDEYQPRAPEHGHLVAATFDNVATDDQPFYSSVRHVTVWVNEGRSENEARAAQPRLHEADLTVLPIRDLEVIDEEGTVHGKWRAIPGLHRVDVFRIPVDLAIAQPFAYQIGTKLDGSAISQGGFTDAEAEPGAEYEYRVFAVAETDRSDLISPPVAGRLRLDTVIEPVSDLNVTQRDDSDNYDLTFTRPPQGSVEIYRTHTQPPGGIAADLITRDVLEREGFVRVNLLPQAIDVEGSQAAMRGVPWPKGWSRAYFTPVTVLDDAHIQVGTYKVLTRAAPVSDLRLVERVDEQFLTFAWPEGVAFVKVFIGSRGSTSVDPEHETAVFELSEEEYRRLGGAHLKNPLPAGGCAVHVVASSYSGGQARYSRPVTVEYRGLIRVYYELVPLEASGRRLMRQSQPVSTARRVHVRCSVTSPTGQGLRLALVHNPTRLPLHIGDGDEVESRHLGFVKDQPVVFSEHVDLGGRGGFVRLFVDVPPDLPYALAVLDPALAQLRCS